MDHSTFTNKEYYDSFCRWDEKTQKWDFHTWDDTTQSWVPNNQEPTIGDLVKGMRAKGNAEYLEKYEWLEPGYSSPDAKGPNTERPLKGEDFIHDVCHVCARIGHTPEQEMFLVAFQLGYMCGPNKRQNDGLSQESYADEILFRRSLMERQYKENGKKYLKDPARSIDSASRKNFAIHFAAGMYLRQKLDLFYDEGLHKKDYSVQRQFADEYMNPENDRIASPGQERNVFRDMKEDFPASLALITPPEWKAITALAAGLYKPGDKMPYPQRLENIRQALDDMQPPKNYPVPAIYR